MLLELEVDELDVEELVELLVELDIEELLVLDELDVFSSVEELDEDDDDEPGDVHQAICQR